MRTKPAGPDVRSTRRSKIEHGGKTITVDAINVELQLNFDDALEVAVAMSSLRRRWGPRYRTRFLLMAQMVVRGEQGIAERDAKPAAEKVRDKAP